MEVTICWWYSAYKKTAKKQNIKPHNPFQYERSGSDIVSKLCKQKPKQSTKGSQKSKKQPPWWDSETEKAWTKKYARNWQKGRTRSNPDPKLKAAMGTKTEQFKQIACGKRNETEKLL